MASALPARARLLDLARLRCNIFNTTFNPTSTRTGAKYLRARLRGPSMVGYYPEQLSMRHLNAMFPEAPNIPDLAEVQRVQDVEAKKARGKGAPKKAKSKGMQLCASGRGIGSDCASQRTAAEWQRRSANRYLPPTVLNYTIFGFTCAVCPRRVARCLFSWFDACAALAEW